MEVFSKFYSWVINFLPNSPFTGFIDSVGSIPYLPEFNWFFPVGEVIVLLGVWLAAVSLYFLYSAIVRLIGLIGR